MQGLSRSSGTYLSDIESVKQSMTDILTTPKGSRVMLRDYGSDIYKYRDNPINNTTIANIYKAIAEAIDTWEPRVSLTSGKLTVETNEFGKLVIDVEFIYKPTGTRNSLGVITV